MKRWFSSELVNAMLKKAGLLKKPKTKEVTPAMLRESPFLKKCTEESSNDKS